MYVGPGSGVTAARRADPDRYNPFREIQLDTQGNFWILEYARDRSGKVSTRFRVMSPSGELIAFADPFPVKIVGTSTNVHIGRDAVLRTFEDSDGVPKVGVFRIRRTR
jgi:hypothetical protein